MSKFKVGDRVKLKSGNKFSSGKSIMTISELSKIEEGMVYFSESFTHCYIDLLELAYPNPPHKHRDLIIEWANGAEIELLSDRGGWVYAEDPCWSYDTVYRVKPQKSEHDIEIENIQKQMDELKERLEKLKGEES